MDLTNSFMPIPEVIAKSLRSLDGNEQFSYLLLELPVGASLFDIDPSDHGTYLQAAGTSRRMTIEMRDELGEAGHHYTVGRRNDPRADGRMEHVEFLGSSMLVFPNEVFDSEEAIPIFHYYYVHNTTPRSFELRALQTG